MFRAVVQGFALVALQMRTYQCLDNVMLSTLCYSTVWTEVDLTKCDSQVATHTGQNVGAFCEVNTCPLRADTVCSSWHYSA